MRVVRRSDPHRAHPNGFPKAGVPDLQDGAARARQARQHRLQARMEDYFFLRDRRTPIEEAARRVGASDDRLRWTRFRPST